jgi:dihydroorotase
VKGLPVHTILRGRFVMRDRTLVQGTKGWGRSVHDKQTMPAPTVRNAGKTMRAVTREVRSSPSTENAA